MRKSGGNAATFGGIDGQTWRAFLIAKHPIKTARAVAAATGLPVDTVDKWLRGATAPSFAATCALIAAYGPEFLAVCVPGCAWFSEAARAAHRARVLAQIAELEGERLSLEAAR